jgi:alpha-D-ribose 1-methylphosphonate 5-triphosphate synthase subunit PhnH
VRAGFADPVFDAQRVFRRVLMAMGHPGRIVTVEHSPPPPAPLTPASAAVCLALLDFETPLWLDATARRAETIEWLRFHCGVAIVDTPGSARFAVVAAATAMPALEAFDAGTDAMPDRSATLILQVDALEAGTGQALSGPGLASTARLDVRGAPPSFWDLVRANAARFPRGVDFVVTAGTRLAALPRGVRVEEE